MALRQSCVLAAVLLLTACGTATPTAGSTALPLVSARLTSFTASYALSGSTPGTVTWTVAARGSSDSLTLTTTAGGTHETDNLTVAARGLELQSLHETITAPSTAVTINATVKGSTLTEDALVNGKAEHVTLSLTKPWVENAELLLFLSGLRLGSGETATVQDVIAKHATTASVGLSVGKETSVTTTAGTWEAHPVTITAAGQADQTAWIMAASPHALVKYHNAKETLTLSAVSP